MAKYNIGYKANKTRLSDYGSFAQGILLIGFFLALAALADTITRF